MCTCILYLSQFRGRVYSEDQHDVSVEATELFIREAKNDVPSLLCVEIARLEQELGVVYTLDRWSQDYRELIKVR